MRHAIKILPVFLLLLLAFASADDKQKFDGNWQTTLSCPNFRDALGYSYQFVSSVKDGVIHGVHGTEGQPTSLVLDGKISPDGKASLYAKGRTGSKEYVPGRDTPERNGVWVQHQCAIRGHERYWVPRRRPSVYVEVCEAVTGCRPRTFDRR